MIQVIRAKPDKSGCKLVVNLAIDSKTKEPVVYAKLTKQHGWIEGKNKTGYGTFLENKDDPAKNVGIKFSDAEVGALVNALSDRGEFSTVHVSDIGKASISVKKYAEAKFGFSVSKDGNKFGISLSGGEATAVATFLLYALAKIFDSRQKSKFDKKS
jgi:hypothetical protein